MTTGGILLVLLTSVGGELAHPARTCQSADAGAAVRAGQATARQETPRHDDESKENSSSGFADWLGRGRRLLEDGDEDSRGFFPIFGIVVPGSGLAAGGGYRDYGLFGSPLGFELSAFFSVRNYQLYRANLGFLGSHRHTTDLRPPDTHVSSMVEDGTRTRPGLSLYLDARYRYYPREHFYGLGPGSREDDRTDYLLKGGSYDLVVEAQATPALGFSGRVGILESHLAEGRDPDDPATQERFTSREAPGMKAQPRYLVAGVGAALDTRENPRDPRTGVFLGVAAWRFDARGNRTFDFTRLAFDGRTYLRPPRSPGVVALRAVISADLLGARAEVPFFLAQTLGGSQLLRSFHRARFRDRALAQATVEYRLRPHPLVEVAPFVEVGAVGAGVRALRGRDLRASAGVGLRPNWKGSVLGRMDYAVGGEGMRLVFAIGQAF